MDNCYRKQKLIEAWKILKEEYSKPENYRNSNQIDHASYLIWIYAEKNELPRNKIYDKDFFDATVFDIRYFKPNTILKYVDRMLSKAEKEMEEINDEKQPDNVIKLEAIRKLKQKEKEQEQAQEIFIEVEEVKDIVKDIIELGYYISIPDVLEHITNVMAGKEDIQKLRKMINVAFSVSVSPENPKYGHFSNDAFVKRLWNSLNMLQRKWLIKNGLVVEDEISIINSI